MNCLLRRLRLKCIKGFGGNVLTRSVVMNGRHSLEVVLGVVVVLAVQVELQLKTIT